MIVSRPANASTTAIAKTAQARARHALPWRNGNQFRLLVDGEAFYPAMLHAIEAAQRHIRLEMYLFSSGQVADRFITALSAAAGRGVQVRLLIDDFGARGLNSADRGKLLQHGVKIAHYNPLAFSAWHRNLFRDHRKLLVVDDCCAFVGGAGLTDDFDRSSRGHLRWHDVMVEIRGPILSDWQHVFEANWSRWSPIPCLALDPLPAAVGTQRGRVSLAGRHTAGELKRTLLRQLSHAQQRAWLATAYFVPTWKLRRRLAHAARRGVDVRLLVPGPHTDHPAVRHASWRFYRKLLRAGVRIYEFSPRFQHAKITLIDDWVSIGSSNLDRWNLRWNLEANQEIQASDLLADVTRLFQNNFVTSHERHAHTWHRRPWSMRAAERFWGTIDRALERFAQWLRIKKNK